MPGSITNVPNNSNITLNIPIIVWEWTSQQTNSVSHLTWHYGNWAGPGGSGVPIDDVDAEAMMHDYCYANARGGPFGTITNMGGYNPELQACNQALCDTEGKIRADLDHQTQFMSPANPQWMPLKDMKNAAKDIQVYFYNVPRHGNGCHDH